jgi:2'-5' RNA ligase
VRLPRATSLHVTLVFLGYQAERDIPRIQDVAFEQEPREFVLTAENVTGVPPRRSRLYALGLTGAGGDLDAWQRGLSDRLSAAGLYEPEKRPFWPHVTLARCKRPQRVTEAPAELPGELREPFTTDRVTLYRSTLRPQGAVYEALAEASTRSENLTG